MLLLDMIPYSNAGIAQLVEHLIRNEGVVGSSPITGTSYKKIPVWGFFILIFVCLQMCVHDFLNVEFAHQLLPVQAFFLLHSIYI